MDPLKPSQRDKAWMEFMETPLADLERFSMGPKYLSKLGEVYGLYVKNLIAVTAEDLSRVQNFGVGNRKNLARSLFLLQEEIERRYGVKL